MKYKFITKVQTPYLTDGYSIFMNCLCLIFFLLKVVPVISDLYSFYCLTIIIYNVLETKETIL